MTSKVTHAGPANQNEGLGRLENSRILKERGLSSIQHLIYWTVS